MGFYRFTSKSSPKIEDEKIVDIEIIVSPQKSKILDMTSFDNIDLEQMGGKDMIGSLDGNLKTIPNPHGQNIKDGLVNYEIYEDEAHDEERAFYGLDKIYLERCKIDGPADGESAFKECTNVIVNNCDINLRYPFWHSSEIKMINCRMPETCRASIWYSQNIETTGSQLHGIKAFRECENITISNCDVQSEEFGWRCSNINVENTKITSVYPFFECKNINATNLTLGGKYSFQYLEKATFTNCNIDTKDAFWHSKDVTVYDSVVKGEYLAWYSTNLKLVRCKIIGTQPFCYTKGLVLEDCEMIDCDLSFELSDVVASVKGNITSVKNPKSGSIIADSIGEIINDDIRRRPSTCTITIRKEQ
ncbi:uncharacterized protein TRFO_36302 [Tritrichomonas foetus]|uniref:DUF3737 family protein n=1 Tax=Tritrichomonas foetus TaxID=1144522 RepID=A0A1J4JFP3_9EUKA|nr:uncharacterized protein TRFO_36302 [Tritrichomonas foetus]|eukprot:OHS97481.1 uncharacterized protein TRFO_36302 [Tritrichomonas foetus]